MAARRLGFHPDGDWHTWFSRDKVPTYHQDVRKHGFQYPDWQFAGDDIVAVSRTAYDDGVGGAHNYHDANFLTFHRISGFRQVKNLELPEITPPAKTTAECRDFVVEGYGFEIATLDNEATAFGNRVYVWKNVPESFCGWRFTRTDGGVAAKMRVIARRAATIYAMTGSQQEGTDTTGWELLDCPGFTYSTRHGTPMVIMRRSLVAGQALTILQTNWSGTMILIPPGDE